MDTNKMREQFDAWLCNKYGHLVRPICWNGGYPSTPDGFMATEIELAWIAWQAAYAAGVEDAARVAFPGCGERCGHETCVGRREATRLIRALLEDS